MGGYGTFEADWPRRATLELRGPAAGLTLAPDVLERLRTRLAEFHPEVEMSTDGLLTVQVTVAATVGGEAIDQANRLVFRALDDAGVPDWPVVRSEVVRGDELGRRR